MRYLFGCLILLCINTIPTLQTSADLPQVSAEQKEIQDKPLPAEILRVLATPAFAHNGHVWCVLATQDGKRFVTGSNEGVILWDAASGQRLLKFPERNATCVALSPSGDLLAMGHDCRRVAVYELLTGKEHFIFEHRTSAYASLRGLAFAPDGRTLASAAENTIQFWKCSKGEAAGVLQLATTVQGLVFRPDGKTLFSAGLDGTVREWDSSTCKEIRVVFGRPNWWIHNLVISADGKSLGVAAQSYGPESPGHSSIHVFDLASSKDRFVAPVPIVTHGGELALSPDGRYVATTHGRHDTTSAKKGAIVWDSWIWKEFKLDAGAEHEAQGLCYLPGGNEIATGGADGKVRLWSATNGIENRMTTGPAGMVRSVAFASSGEVLASFNTGGEIQLWSVREGKKLQTLREHDEPVYSISFAANGETLFSYASGRLTRKSSGYFWNVKTGERLKVVPPVEDLDATVIAPDGKTAASVNADGAIVLWDLATSAVRKTLGGLGRKLGALAFSLDGRLLAATSTEGTVRVWHLDSGLSLYTIPARISGREIERLWFSQDGSLLFMSYPKSGMPTILSSKVPKTFELIVDTLETVSGTHPFERVLSVASAQIRYGTFPGIGTTFLQLEGGSSMLVACESGQFRVLDMIAGDLAGPEIAYGGEFTTAEFSPDGKMLALGYQDGRLLLCKPPPIPQRKPLPNELEPKKLHDLWQSLAATDAKAAYQARWLLSAASKQTLPLFREQVQPTQPPDLKKVEAWIKQLASDSFKERETATQELQKVGDVAEPALRKALEQKMPLEPRQRIDQILKKLATPPTGETLRSLRAIVILESIGNDEAKAILQALAEGAPGSRVTEAAQAALKRLVH